MISAISVLGCLWAFAATIQSPATSLDEIKADISKVIADTVLKKNPGYPNDSVAVYITGADPTLSSLLNRKGKLTFAIVDESEGFNPIGDVIMPVQVYEDGIASGKLHLQARVKVFIGIVVASKKMNKLAVIKAEDLALSRQDIGALPKTFFTSKDDVSGKQLMTSLSSGTVVLGWMLRVPPMISKNDDVEILAETETLKVSAMGIALEDGNAGDKIKVRNSDTKREIKAIVVDAHSVRVKI